MSVTWSDGFQSNEKVTWTSANYTNGGNKAKVVTLTGMIANTNLKSKATVIVHEIKSVSNVSVSTATVSVIKKVNY